MLAIALAWILSAHTPEGPPLHFLATPLVALMFGRDLAAIAVAPAILAAIVWRQGEWASAPATWLLAGLLPAHLAHLLLRAAERFAPRNVFTYIFLSGFFTPGIVFALTVVAAAAVHVAAGTAPWQKLADGFVPYGLLLSWGEAFLSGLLAAIFVVYEPRWMVTFDDARYLRPPGT